MNDIDTDTVLNELAIIKRAIANIAKSRSTWRKYLKAHKEGRVTAEQVENAKSVLRGAIADDLEAAFNAGFTIAQGDLCDFQPRAENAAADIIR